MNSLRFDDALPTALQILQKTLGDALPETTLVRDPTGALTIVLPDDAFADAAHWDAVAAALHDGLGYYSPGLREVLLRESDLIDPDDILASPDRIRLPEVPHTWLVDRLLTNQDWLRAPLWDKPPIPTATAFSIKGGVGRSTAFALWAWHLARQGRRVVVVDLDLESPGIGSLLLDQLPDYGLVDWLVENLNGPVEPALLRDCLLESRLVHDTAGTLRVLPAFGANSRNYVAKLGRVYLPTLNADGHMIGLAERLAELLKALAALPEPPDVVLLDARAGLHDIGSAAVTRLGAEVFLFGRDDYPSWLAYQQLFQHLTHAHSVSWGMPDDDLRWRLKMVAAQIEAAESARARLIEASYDAWSTLYDADAEPPAGEPTEPQLFERDAMDAPHYPLFIPYREDVKTWNLVDPADRPDWRTVQSVFGDFFAEATARVLKNNGRPAGAGSE